MNKKAFGTYDIAKICHVTPPTVGHWINEGKIPSFSTAGGHRRVWGSDLAAFMRAHNMPLTEELVVFSGPPICLVIDDDADIRKTIVRLISKVNSKVQVHEAADGFMAGRKITLLNPGLVILDLRLPGVDGFEICQMIRKDLQLQGVKIVAISGYADETVREKILRCGADFFFAKPFEIGALTEALKSSLEPLGHWDQRA